MRSQLCQVISSKLPQRRFRFHWFQVSMTRNTEYTCLQRWSTMRRSSRISLQIPN